MVTEPVVPRGVDDGDTDGDGVVVGRTDALEEALGVVDGVEGVEAVGDGEVGGCGGVLPVHGDQMSSVPTRASAPMASATARPTHGR